MKIAIFTPYNIFKHGGVQEHVQYQSEILRKRGHDVTILTPRPRLKKNEDAPKGVVFLGVSARIKAPHATSADVSVTLDNDAIDAELEKNYDIVHVHEPLVPVAARQILARAEGSAVRVGTFHAALPGNRFRYQHQPDHRPSHQAGRAGHSHQPLEHRARRDWAA